MSEKPRLLLFDDDEKTADLIIDSLSDDFNVTWVSKQEELENIISDEFVVIVTDVSIKGSDKTGFELIDDFRRNMRITKTPIVVYSAKVNICEIEDEQGKLFFAYVDKGEKVMGEELLAKCLEAAEQKRNMISWEVFKTYFERLGKLDVELEPEDLGKLSFHIDIQALRTVRQLLDQLTKADLSNELWVILDELAWELYAKYTKEEIGKRS